MASLENVTPGSSYQSLLKTVDNTGITGSLKQISDGTGSATPLYLSTSQVQVAGTISAGKFEGTDITDSGTPNATFRVNRTLNSSISANAHGFRDQTIFQRPTYAYNSYDTAAYISGSGNHDHLIGFQSRVGYVASGTLSDLYGGGTFNFVNGGTASRSYGWDVADVTGSGSVVENYGYRAQQMTKGTYNFAFYSVGSTPSLLEGRLGVGLSPLTTPGATVHIKGSGATAGGSAFLVQNSSSTDLLRITNDGGVKLSNQTLATGKSSSGNYLPITINNVQYYIQLFS
jgi:hypothetical protein